MFDDRFGRSPGLCAKLQQRKALLLNLSPPWQPTAQQRGTDVFPLNKLEAATNK